MTTCEPLTADFRECHNNKLVHIDIFGNIVLAENDFLIPIFVFQHNVLPFDKTRLSPQMRNLSIQTPYISKITYLIDTFVPFYISPFFHYLLFS